MPETKREWVRSRVLELIEPMAPGDVLPPERQLSEELGVARMTLRRAVEDLVRDGVVVRRQGSGTYVAEPKLAGSPSMMSFSQRAQVRGQVPSSRTLSATVRPATAGLGIKLDISPGDEVMVFERLRLADGIPLAVETLHVPARLVPGLTGDDLDSSSFYDLLAHRYGIRVTHGVQAIDPTVTNDRESELLDVPMYSPAFRFELSTWTEDSTVVEYLSAVHRGDRSRLIVELEPRADDRPGPAPTAIQHATPVVSGGYAPSRP